MKRQVVVNWHCRQVDQVKHKESLRMEVRYGTCLRIVYIRRILHVINKERQGCGSCDKYRSEA